MASNKKSSIEETTSEECANEGCCSPDLTAEIAECAYYKAEKRGFAPGHEIEDWYEAEQEMLAGKSDVL
ncbi:DUF2934 domain-containing protein [Methylicorpusculum oleiharenae]|uniref:DUF2934 domain-containing protein n=1 Tax=Methylicorpusculum oleiharenae TaxID=1338687 RepID=UPI001359B771|nr:DUF2934 domain-containing protein [Methylicorpusculum oleiharenae]MCD2453374.1 DUF2934 domain-containing protein [Methylicorpusculum oleiharenae]MDD2761440.1 DUF2934 domain-containing protein [Methylomonas sp.]